MGSKSSNHVTVTVDGSGNPACSPDPVNAKGGNVKLHFDLATPGYAFADTDAVVVSSPGTQFPHPSHTHAGGTKATLLNRNSERGDFKYTVRLKELSSGRLIELDPTIKNET